MVIKFHFPDTFFNKKVFIRLGSRILDKKIIQLFNYGWKKKKVMPANLIVGCLRLVICAKL